MTRVRPTFTNLGKGIGALGLLVILVVGVPALLWQAIGWPLPRTVPDMTALGEPVSDTVLVNGLAVVCWLAWAQLVIAVVVELIAWARGRAASRLPYARSTQRFAAWLVSSALLLVTPGVAAAWTPSPPLPAPAQQPASAWSAATADTGLPATPSTTVSTVEPADVSRPPPARGALKTYVVVRRDTLWAIAERHLQDPRRWPEILDLNKGRRQEDGRALDDPRRIHSGWVLHLPSDAVGLPEAAATESSSGSTDAVDLVEVAPGDTLSAVAEGKLGDADSWPAIYDLTEGQPQPRGETLADPDLIRPGWTLRVPLKPRAQGPSPAPVATPAPVSAHPAAEPLVPSPPTSSGSPSPDLHTPPSTESPAPQTTVSAGRTPTEPSAPPAPTIPDLEQSRPAGPRTPSSPSPNIPVGILGSGLLAAGLVAILDRLRRIQRRHRRPDHRLPAPEPDLAPTETALRSAADEEGAGRLDQVLRAMAAGMAEAGLSKPPPVVAVQLTGGKVEILLGEAGVAPPSGFKSAAEGWMWTVDEKLGAAEIERRANSIAPLPALVTMGVTESGQLLVDLETAGSTAVTGDPEAVAGLLRSVALELSTSVWADHVQVVLVGFELPELDLLDRVQTFDSLDEVVDQVEAEATAVGNALDDAGCSSTLAARTRKDASDGWSPLVIVCADPPTDHQAERLVKLAGEGGRGLAVLASGNLPSARWRLEVEQELINIPPLGLRVRPQFLSAGEADRLHSLLDTAANAQDVELPEDREEPDEPLAALVPDAPFEEPTAEIEVRVLGPVEVVGSQGELSGKPLELVTYLATHPTGVDADRLKAALWPPDKPPAQKTLANTVSSTRHQLGLAANGGYHLPPASKELYRPAPSVTTDLERFETLVRHAEHEHGHDATARLRRALGLVRGRPFTAIHGFDWAEIEGLVARTDAVIVDAAHRLAQLCLDAGDIRSAEWALSQGLLASPGNELLYRDRMLAADAAGNPAGVEAVLDELCQVVEALEPYDALHPETLAVYERVSRKRRVAG